MKNQTKINLEVKYDLDSCYNELINEIRGRQNDF